ncbi:hypothetical protein TNCV_3328061 [Trichonephila clavipes]|nr:hypothetical protein TNCV_3328061 [Trichonephila clavipes]
MAVRKRKEEMKIAKKKRRDDFKQRMRNVEMEFELQKNLIDQSSGGRPEDGRRINERIALEEEMRLEKERRLVEDQMRHVQEEHKMSIKTEEQKCLHEVPTVTSSCS